MALLRRAVILAGLCGLLVNASGCSNALYNLQPHRLQRLNRGEGMRSAAEAYSIVVRPTDAA